MKKTKAGMKKNKAGQRKNARSAQLPKSAKKRLLFVMIAVFVLFGGIAVKMGYIVFAQGEQLQERALIQQTRDVVVAAERGNILDRNGNILAQSANAQTVVLRPDEIKDFNVDGIVAVLSETLGIDEEIVRKKATDESKREVWLARQIPKDTANDLRKLGLPGVYFTVEIKRYYPNSAFLTQTLGFTSVDGVGLEGLEAYYNKTLSGTPGRVVSETDERGAEIPLGHKEYVAPKNGQNVVLTVDEVLQSFLENALSEAMEAHGAAGASGIAMDPHTGEILAIADMPDYDLNAPPRGDMALLSAYTRNRVLTQEISPGTLMEIVTAAGAIDSGAVDSSDKFDTAGYSVVDGRMYTCWCFPEQHGVQTVYEAAQNACNAAFIDMGQRMGTQTYYDYLYGFGFGQESGITFPADQGGIVMAEKYVQNSDLARITFGQSIAVTPLQLVSSISAVVNGGFLYEPKLVASLGSADGTVLEKYEPQVISTPIKSETSAIMREMMKSAVRFGVAKNCYIPGFAVGGAAGTSRKYDEDGVAIDGKHTASFVGFAPADDPQIVVLIVLDEPAEAYEFGRYLVAPYVRDVLFESLQYLGAEPDFEQTAQLASVIVPDAVGMTLTDAIALFASVGLKYAADGYDDVSAQYPAAGQEVDYGTAVLLTMQTKNDFADTSGLVVVPDLTGLTVMEAALLLESHNLRMVLEDGRGAVANQTPAAGTMVPEGSGVIVEFAKQSE